MLTVKNQPCINLDKYLDISKLLALETEFYHLYATNSDKASSTWTSGSIPLDTSWKYLKDHHTLYHHSHTEEFDFPTADREKLAVFLQLKYNSFNPYKILHLYNNGFLDFVKEYPDIIDAIESLPFKSIQSASLFYNQRYMPQGYHRDYNYWPVEQGDQPTPPESEQNLIWFRFDLDREFYIYDIDDVGKVKNEIPVEGHAVYFNHYTWHGNIHTPNKTSLTIKIEGDFEEDFYARI